MRRAEAVIAAEAKVAAISCRPLQQAMATGDGVREARRGPAPGYEAELSQARAAAGLLPVTIPAGRCPHAAPAQRPAAARSQRATAAFS